MTITEANAVNVVLREPLGLEREGQRPEAALQAVEFLADKAHKPLMAGLTGPEVRSLWVTRP